MGWVFALQVKFECEHKYDTDDQISFKVTGTRTQWLMSISGSSNHLLCLMLICMLNEELTILDSSNVHFFKHLLCLP